MTEEIIINSTDDSEFFNFTLEKEIIEDEPSIDFEKAESTIILISDQCQAAQITVKNLLPDSEINISIEQPSPVTNSEELGTAITLVNNLIGRISVDGAPTIEEIYFTDALTSIDDITTLLDLLKSQVPDANLDEAMDTNTQLYNYISSNIQYIIDLKYQN